MNHKPEIEELLAAVQRQHADRIRQEKLCETITRLAETEEKGRGKIHKIWIAAGIAASLLLVTSIGWNFIGRSSSSRNSKPIVAKKSPYIPDTSYDDSAATSIPTQNIQHPNVIASAKHNNITHPKTDVSNVPTQDNDTKDINPTTTEETLFANESSQTIIVHNTNQTETDESANNTDSQPRIHERSSERIVRTNRSTNQQLIYQENTLQFASLNCSSTSTTFKLGTIHF